MMGDRILPREMAECALKADRVVALRNGVVRLEKGNFAEVFVPYEWVVARRTTTPNTGE